MVVSLDARHVMTLTTGASTTWGKEREGEGERTKEREREKGKRLANLWFCGHFRMEKLFILWQSDEERGFYRCTLRSYPSHFQTKHYIFADIYSHCISQIHITQYAMHGTHSL